MTDKLTQEVIKLIAPGTINEHFELKRIQENKVSITLFFEEKPELIPKKLNGREVVQDGFLNPLELQTFPLKDKQVYLSLRRRRWKEKGSQEQSYSNNYDLHRPGMKTTREFGDFLKEELGWSTSEYNKLWESSTY